MPMGPIVKAGDMRHRVTLQSLSETNSPTGDKLECWTSVQAFWAFVRPASGRELEIAQRLQAQVSHVVTMRYPGSCYEIDATMRFVYKQRLLNIQSVLNVDERNHTLTVYVLEVPDQTYVPPVSTTDDYLGGEGYGGGLYGGEGDGCGCPGVPETQEQETVDFFITWNPQPPPGWKTKKPKDRTGWGGGGGS